MSRMKVVLVPDAVLNQTAKPVTYKEPQLRQLLLDMKETLVLHEDPPGVGLAAPQVGVSLRIFLAMVTPANEKKPGIEIFINPEIVRTAGSTDKSKKEKGLLEGCLSLPQFYGPVTRAVEVEVAYDTVSWEALVSEKNKGVKELVTQQRRVFYDFEARIMQHEIDHLEGRLFPSRLIEQGGEMYRVEEETNGKQVFVPVNIEV